MCTNGERKCIQCDQIIKIHIHTMIHHNQQESISIGEYRLSPNIVKATPCLLETGINSHRLIFPGQQTWFEERCYFCSLRGDRLIAC
jgi:hypothetical protein